MSRIYAAAVVHPAQHRRSAGGGIAIYDRVSGGPCVKLEGSGSGGEMITDTDDAPPCIYCGERGPYKEEEHVVSAGLGSGDDPEWLLARVLST